MEDQMIKSYADILKKLITRYNNLIEISFSYFSGIHQVLTDGLNHPELHFYPLLLRSVTFKKFKVGNEMLANPQREITQEYCAITLRNLSDQHYKQK